MAPTVARMIPPITITPVRLGSGVLHRPAAAQYMPRSQHAAPRGDQKHRFDHTADPWYSWIKPTNMPRTDREGDPGVGQRWSQADGTVRSLPVVVLAIGPERSIQMPPAPDERPVEALGPHRLDHPFRVGVGIRCPDRGTDDPHPLRAQHLVERSAELCVPVPDEEPDGAAATIVVHREVPGLLGDPRRVGVNR